MWIAAWITGLVLLALVFGEQERNWINPNSSPASITTNTGIIEVVLQRNRQGHYVTNGKINGKPAEFLLDTGATDVAISSALAEQFSLQPGARGTAITANGKVTVYATRIARLEIGDIQLENVRASINPGMGDFILLGMSALRQIEFLQRGDTLTLRQQP